MSETKNLFWIFSGLLKCGLDLNSFKKKLTLIPNGIPKLRTRKQAIRYVYKKCCFTVPFDKRHSKDAETHFKSSRRDLDHSYWSPIRILSSKKSLLLISKMLWLFVNTFTANDKYSPLNRDNFTQPIQMQLSQKWKAFSDFFIFFEI